MFRDNAKTKAFREFIDDHAGVERFLRLMFQGEVNDGRGLRRQEMSSPAV